MVFFVFVPVRAKLAADLSLKVSYWLPWSLARSLNETGFRAVLNYAARIGSDGTVPRSGLKSGQKRLSGGLSERLSNPSDGGAASPLSNVGDKTLNDIAAFHLNGNRSGETQSVLASEESLINTQKE